MEIFGKLLFKNMYTSLLILSDDGMTTVTTFYRVKLLRKIKMEEIKCVHQIISVCAYHETFAWQLKSLFVANRTNLKEQLQQSP